MPNRHLSPYVLDNLLQCEQRIFLLWQMIFFSSLKGNIVSQTAGSKRATPLCLPNNCKWDSRSGQYIKTGEKRSSLYVVDEALENLRKIKGNHKLGYFWQYIRKQLWATIFVAKALLVYIVHDKMLLYVRLLVFQGFPEKRKD